MILQVRPEHIDDWWPIVEPMLAQPLEMLDEGVSTDRVYERLKDQTALLWVVLNSNDNVHMALVITEQNNWLNVWLLAGKSMHTWFDQAVDHVKRYAKERGMKGVTALTRPGLARKLEYHKWRCAAKLMRWHFTQTGGPNR